MCEFCLKHGEGKKWYLQAKNYSDELLSDMRRRRMIEEFFANPGRLTRGMEHLKRLDKAPNFIKGMIGRIITSRQKKTHFGQVVPIEEIEQIFGFVGSIVRVACICREVTLQKEKRYCYGVSMSPDGGQFTRILQGLDKSFLAGPDVSGMETLSKEEAISALRDHEREGLCHTVWTFQSPFIGGICNCDRSDCLAMRCTVTHSIPVMFRAEYVAEVDPDACLGCRECMRVCQFGAIVYSASNRKVTIDQKQCYGCGICRSVCKTKAIRLNDRNRVPAAANVW
ncbi:MAG: 4Fe-4S binding protein [Sedimentisphaerales bacterium]|nr:4Fe-4S binding protein [Sedimentisphaerales bacterium]